MRRFTFHHTPEQIATAFKSRRPLLLVVYHRGHRARVRRLRDGWQPTPWRCPKCRRAVKDPDELRYLIATETRS